MAEEAEEVVMCIEEEDEESPATKGEILDARTLANRKKKLKKKEKKHEDVSIDGVVTAPDGSSPLSGPGDGHSESSPVGSELVTPLPSPQPSPAMQASSSPSFAPSSRKGEKDCKKAALVKAAHERLDHQRKMEEDRLAHEQEQQRLLEEEQQRLEEEEAAAQADRQRKLDAKHAKVDKAKAEGTYQTKAQKLKAAKAAMAREQLLSPCIKPKSDPSITPSPSPCMKPNSDPAAAVESNPSFCLTVEEAVTYRHRSPIVCIMGHVDTGKTKLLDKLRCTNVQEREAGGITQQIGATFFPASALAQQTNVVDAEFNISVPGLLLIDTPGHEAFNNLRSRGSSLCDLAVVVVDIMHGLEVQTVESLEMLREHNCPFIIALNKIDVFYKWASVQNTSAQAALQRQEDFVLEQFHRQVRNVILELNERGHNASLYWENDDPDSCISLVPTSAYTGEGVPDLLYTLLNRAQTSLSEQLELKEEVKCTVIEVKHTDGMGTTVDVLLINGSLHEGDQIVLAGMNGPIQTTIRALLTPLPMKEMRVKGEWVHHPSISTSMGVKISAAGLEKAVCGSDVFVIKESSGVKELQDNVQANFKSILSGFEKQAEGVHVKASTIGSLEALLSFLGKMQVPVSDMSIGEVHKKDVTQAAIMKEKKVPEYALILAFDVKVNADAKKEAKHAGVEIFTADVIYKLFDQFQAHMEKTGPSKRPLHPAVFPCILEVTKPSTVQSSDASLIWCQVTGGHLRIGTPLCLFGQDCHRGEDDRCREEDMRRLRESREPQRQVSCEEGEHEESKREERQRQRDEEKERQREEDHRRLEERRRREKEGEKEHERVQANAQVGHVIEILKERRPADTAFLGDRVCIKLSSKATQAIELDTSSQLCSLISRESNETLKESFHSELMRTDWACLDTLKKAFKIE